ncbi:MAG TPA: hypothetical protein ENI23_11595 [bacterium]|nr:hypothetical protein [bacterium]
MKDSIDIEKLNKYALKRFDDYQNLDIRGVEVSSPYYSNNVEYLFLDMMERAGVTGTKRQKVHNLYKTRKVSHGWYRGKGTPEQIIDATKQIAKDAGINLRNATDKGIRAYMFQFSLGIDCSGLIYELLRYSFKRVKKLTEFKASLNWEDPKKKRASRAGTFIFGEPASIRIEPDEIRPLDFVMKKNLKDQKYTHMGMILRKKGKGLVVVQSSMSTSPNGVNMSKIRIVNNVPKFEFKPTFSVPWEKHFKRGKLEFRRLKILTNQTK